MGIVAVGYFFLIGWFLGLTVLEKIKVKLDLLIKLAGGWLIGIILLTHIIFWQSFLIPFSGQIILATLGLITIVCGWQWYKYEWIKTIRKDIKRIKKRELIRLLIFFGFWGVLFFIIWKNMLVMEPDGLYAGWVNIWGDWAAHLTYTTSFGYGDNFPPQMPILAGYKFAYPFLADFLSAILIKLRVNLITAMLMPSWLLSMMLVVMLTGFGKAVVKNWKAGILTVWLFLLNGGLGFWWWFKDIKELGWQKVVNNLPREYTHLEKLSNIEWINIITSQVIPQRGFLLGFPLAIFIYTLLWKHWNNKRREKILFLAGGLTALLPLIHAHSFIMIGFVGVTLALMEIVKSRGKNKKLKIIKKWVKFFLPIILVGLGQWFYFFGTTAGNKGFIRFKFGWLSYRDNYNILWFWVKNLGIIGLLLIVAIKKAGEKLKLFSLPFWGLFILANLWIFQPWEWDNSKFFTHWYLIVSVLIAGMFVKLLEQKKLWKKMLIGGLLIVSILAGGLDVWRLTQYKYRKIRFWGNEELGLSNWVRKNTLPKAIFLTANNHDHWLPTLTGRKTILGFPGWLWTYGINYSVQEKVVNEMFAGENNTALLLKKYNVDYVIIGPLEKAKNINENYYQKEFSVIKQTKTTKIYQVK